MFYRKLLNRRFDSILKTSRATLEILTLMWNKKLQLLCREFSTISLVPTIKLILEVMLQNTNEHPLKIFVHARIYSLK